MLAESARQEATAAQVRLDTGERLPLLGVPIAIKDDVDIAGEVTTYGTAAHGPAKTDDAEVVRKLRAAGVVIVGKTTVPGDDAVVVHGDRRLRRDAQPVEHRLCARGQ